MAAFSISLLSNKLERQVRLSLESTILCVKLSYIRGKDYFWIAGFGSAHGMSEVAADTRRDIALVALVIGLVLEEDELVRLVIGTVVGRVRHNKIINPRKNILSPQLTLITYCYSHRFSSLFPYLICFGCLC